MKLEAIKLDLIAWLSKLEDQDTIEFLQVVKESQGAGADWWDELSDVQKDGIEKGLNDIKEGRVISQEEVRKALGS
ncbi:hypothetical protein FHG64_14710 [Antarcticibacterium flavum]|uniref:Addiction module protein n=1 Tax=Antarcticibacterium flavum TaxID=2058175 RepID=A0A5B7X5B9_9FLAO|nr:MULTISPECIES: hypothetical protein [Antarcticibacterium]MCM4161909.1 hypothetical protein [Antarcticibacterium sp. W02-3]QCY70549.1 hypothetical protein FHG64_14710 [Antarcticibacterium flavum]